MVKPRPPRHQYELFIEPAIEAYKSSVPRSALLEIGDEAVRGLAEEHPFALTELLLVEEVDRIILRRLSLPSYREWRYRQAIRLESWPALIDAAGEPFSVSDSRSDSVILLAEEISQELIALLTRSPEFLYQLPPRKFEELVAELLHQRGAEVALTPTSRDGGRDIVASITSPVGAFLCLIECKRYAPNRPVGVRPVRELFGVVSHERVTQGILVTTSDFTRPAREFADHVPHRIALKEYSDIVKWLRESSLRIASGQLNGGRG